jgi:predicted AlkP superfamily pyrophosphatase or phosphodiesterase
VLDCPIIPEGNATLRRTSTLYALVIQIVSAALVLALFYTSPLCAQRVAIHTPPEKFHPPESSPKLVVILVVDQMRADYLDKFQQQWTGGLKRLIDEGAWFHEAAYPYAETETCVGHATISTGALPGSHGMVANEWWDRQQQKHVTCTADATVNNVGYAGATVSGGDSAAKMLLPSFADELKIQSGAQSRIVTMSLKARAAITLAGRQGDSVSWFDGATGAWVTSSAYPFADFANEFAKAHPVKADYGKTWAPLLPDPAYRYEEVADGAGPPSGYNASFPHPLRGNAESKGPDAAFYSQWATSPYADTYLEQMAEAAVDKLHLGKIAGTDFLGISFSSVDYVGHAFGPRSWEVQDELARLDRDLGAFFAHLDKAVGRGNYVVALSSDHGVSPIPEQLRKSGIDAGRLNLYQVKTDIESALESFHFPKPSVADIDGGNIYFTPGTYAKLKSDVNASQAVIEALQIIPGVAHVYTAEELELRAATENPVRAAEAAGFLKSRSGDLIIAPKPYWIWDYSTATRPVRGGTSHGTPYYYDQRVPVILMGWGIRSGTYYSAATPADIAPTLASLCGITLATRDGHILQQAIAAVSADKTSSSQAPSPKKEKLITPH